MALPLRQALAGFGSVAISHSLLSREEELEAFKRLHAHRNLFWMQYLVWSGADEYQETVMDYLLNRDFRFPEDAGTLNSLVDGLQTFFADRKAALDRLPKRSKEYPEFLRPLAEGLSFPKFGTMAIVMGKKWKLPKPMEKAVLGYKKEFDYVYSHNLRFFVHIAAKEIPQHKAMRASHSMEDGIQEGCIGGADAIHRFDHTTGNRLTTYAGWWVRHHVRRSFQTKADVIRAPVHVIEDANKVYKALRKHQLWDRRTEEVIAVIRKETGLKEAEIQRAAEYVRQQMPLSLETPIGQEGDLKLEDMLSDTDPLQEEMMGDGLVSEALREAIDRLPEKLKEIIQRHVEGEETLADVGKDLGVSRERIRQLEVLALNKLRRDPALQQLHSDL